MAEGDILQDHLVLEYHGPKVAGGSMDARQVASQIVAFSDFLDVVCETAYGKRVQIQTEVQGFRKDSFDIDFIFQIGGHVATLMSTTDASPKDVIDIIKHSVALWRHLSGHPPKSQNHAEDNAQLVNVENNNGQILAFNNSIVQVVIDPKAGDAVEKFISGPLKMDGVNSVNIRSQKFEGRAQIEQSDAAYFKTVKFEEPLPKVTIETHLIIESPTFKEGNKWRFFDGQVSFGADMMDKAFLQNVNEGAERFGKGDILRVKMQITQSTTPGRLSAEREILEVLDHKKGSEQQRLL